MKKRGTRAELSRLAERSRPYITRLVSRGDIPLGEDGLVDLKQGLKVIAEKSKEQNGNGNGKKKGKKNDQNGNGKKKKENGKAEPEQETKDRTLHQAQTRLADLKADIAQVEFDQLVGSVVTIDEVDLVFGRLVVAVRQRFLGLGNRVAPTGANKSAPELCEIIDKAVYGALNEFGKYNAETGKCRIQKSNKKGRKPSRKPKATSKTHSR